MAKPVGSDLEGRLAEMRARGLLGPRDGGGYDALVQLHQVRKAFERLEPEPESELYRHFPVATVAVLEAYFRWFVAAVVDSGDPYLARGVALAKEKLRPTGDVLAGLHRQLVSVGELVAYGLPFNSIASLEEPIASLLDAKPKQLFERAIMPHFTRWDAEGEDSSMERPPIVPDIDTMYKNLALTFERRHIFAHEAAPTYNITYDDARAAIDCVDQTCHAMESVLWNTAWRSKPLTQTEINKAAWDSARVARNRLASRLHAGLRIATAQGQRGRFREQHALWQRYARDWLRWQGERFAMGAFRPLYAAEDAEELWSSRAEAVESWIRRASPQFVPV